MKGHASTDALTIAGGLIDSADARSIHLNRGDRRLSFNYAVFLKGRYIDGNVLLESGDEVSVSRLQH